MFRFGTGLLAQSGLGHDSRFCLVSEAEQADRNLTCWKIPKDTFSHDVIICNLT